MNRLLAKSGDKSPALKKIELRRRAIGKWDGQAPLTGDGRIPFTDLNLSR